MPADVVFFLAPDDATAAATRDSCPGHAFTSLTCHAFDPDDAVIEWEMAGDWRPEQPRYVAEIRNDGVGVFVVPATLVAALGKAEPSELRRIAEQWDEHLVRQGDELPASECLRVAEGVAGLAVTAAGSTGNVYCWHF